MGREIGSAEGSRGGLHVRICPARVREFPVAQVNLRR